MRKELVHKIAFSPADFPKTSLPEIALVGKSNVGKSSLINHLLRAKCAKTSSTPGKTQSINFYTLEEKFLIVDLPGYGYAKVAKTAREGWADLIDTYLNTRTSLKAIALLIDCRRTPSEEDLAFIEWASFHKKPLLLILTKIDKLNTSEKEALRKRSLQLPIHSIIYYSIKEESGRISLLRTLNTL